MKPKNRIIVLAIVVISSVGVVAIVGGSHPNRDVARSTDTHVGPPVSVQVVRPESHVATVAALGEVRPEYLLDIVAMVDGRIERAHPELKRGALIAAGEVLVRVEESRYRAEHDAALSALAQAELDLIMAQREAEDAARGWERSGRDIESAGPLTLRQPQLRVAEAAHAAAQSQVRLAERVLADTIVAMPFNGIILSPGPAPQTSLTAGQTIVQVASIEAAEIEITVDDAQWRLLGSDIADRPVRIVDASDKQHVSWLGYVTRVARHIDDESRLRTIWVRVERPLYLDPPLLPGTFVSVELPGRSVPRSLRIPDRALTNAGLVWFVTGQNRLQSLAMNALFYADGFTVVASPEDSALQLVESRGFAIAVAPNNSFVNGMSVVPREIQDEIGINSVSARSTGEANHDR